MPFFNSTNNKWSRCCLISIKKFISTIGKFGRDNKHQYVMEFLSVLMAWKVFQEIYVEVLFVSHTLEDIDGYYNYLSNHSKQWTCLFSLTSWRLSWNHSFFISWNVMLRSLWDWKKCMFSYFVQTIMNDMLFNTRNVYLIQSGWCETSWFACGRMMDAFAPSFPKSNHPLSKLKSLWDHVLNGCYED